MIFIFLILSSTSFPLLRAKGSIRKSNVPKGFPTALHIDDAIWVHPDSGCIASFQRASLSGGRGPGSPPFGLHYDRGNLRKRHIAGAYPESTATRIHGKYGFQMVAAARSHLGSSADRPTILTPRTTAAGRPTRSRHRPCERHSDFPIPLMLPTTCNPGNQVIGVSCLMSHQATRQAGT
jgi:hypothetical protein